MPSMVHSIGVVSLTMPLFLVDLAIRPEKLQIYSCTISGVSERGTGSGQQSDAQTHALD